MNTSSNSNLQATSFSLVNSKALTSKRKSIKTKKEEEKSQVSPFSNGNYLNNLNKKRTFSQMEQQNIQQNQLKYIQPVQVTPVTTNVDSGVNLLDKYLYDDEHVINYDNLLSSSSFQPPIEDNSTYVVKNRIRYPEMIYNEVNSPNDSSYRFTGIFTPLSLIYFAKRNQIYLWNYLTKSEMIYSDIPSDIYNIHITFAKPGVFTSQYRYIMLVSTLNDIFILLISLDGNGNYEIHKTDFIYNTKGDIITSFASTANYRVFASGKHASIFELDYSNSKTFFGFFGKKAKKIQVAKQSAFERLFPFSLYFPKNNYYVKTSVDNTRNILYAVSHSSNSDDLLDINGVVDSSVAIFDLGCEGKDFVKIGDIDQGSIADSFRDFLVKREEDDVDINKQFVIVDAIPLTRTETKIYQLVIITRNGRRIFVRFDTEIDECKIKNENEILSIDTNKIYRTRIIPRFSFTVSALNENKYNTEGINSSPYYDKMFYFNGKTFVVNQEGDVNVREIDIKQFIKMEHLTPVSNSFSFPFNRSSEVISHIFNIDNPLSLIHIAKLPSKAMYSESDLNSLIKMIDYENFLYPNIKYIDMDLHYSIACTHEYITQLFLSPEEYIIMLSDKVLSLIRLRPIDKLFLIISNENNDAQFKDYINTYGLVETTTMLMMIISNRNFVFYKKGNINDNYGGHISMSSSQSNKEYIEVKNNDKIISVAEKLLLKTMTMTLSSIASFEIKNQETLPPSPNKMQQNQIIGTAFVDKKYKIGNFFVHSILLFASRISRLFYEENLFDKIYNLYNEYEVVDAIQLHQLHYIKNILTMFIQKMKGMKDILNQHSSDIDIKMRKIINLLNSRNIIDTLFCDFSNFKNEFDNAISLISKLIELLSFAEIIYDNSTLKKNLIQKNLNEILSLKYKNILNKSFPFVIKALLEELFDTILTDNDYVAVSNKLRLIAMKCPTIITKNEIELIQASLLLKISKTQKQDDITKMNTINRAIKLMMANPESIKIESIIDYLIENKDVKKLIELCVAKATQLHSVVITNNILSESNTATASMISLTENNFSDYKQCIYIIMKLLSEIHLALINENYDIGKRCKENVIPRYIEKLLMSSTKQELEKYQSDIINAVLSFNSPFLHSLLFDHLKNEGMLEDLNRVNSPYVEAYLNSEITKTNCSSSRYVDLYKFYLNSKNYTNAIRILLILVNYENSNSIDYVSLSDRVVYVKHLLYALNNVINLSEGERTNQKKLYLDLKVKITTLENTISIQNEIYKYLEKAVENLSNEKNEDNKEQIFTTREALVLLDRNLYNLDTLYYDFSKKFKIYQMNIKIYYEMYNKNLPIEPEQIKDNFLHYLLMIKNNVNRNFLWPTTSLLVYQQMFITFMEMKTRYTSFYVMLKENGFTNVIEDLLPFSFIAEKTEKMNKDILFDLESTVNYELKANMNFDSDQNIFWFIIFLRNKVQLPIFYIYEEYFKIELVSGMNDIKFYCYMNLIKICLIMFWCENVNSFLEGKEKGLRISRQNVLDFHKFKEKKSELGEQLNKIETLLQKKDLTILMNGKLKSSYESFFAKVKTQFNIQYENVINYLKGNNVNSTNDDLSSNTSKPY